MSRPLSGWYPHEAEKSSQVAVWPPSRARVPSRRLMTLSGMSSSPKMQAISEMSAPSASSPSLFIEMLRPSSPTLIQEFVSTSHSVAAAAIGLDVTSDPIPPATDATRSEPTMPTTRPSPMPVAPSRSSRGVNAGGPAGAGAAGLTASELRALFRVAAEVSVTPKKLAGYLNMTTAAVTFISRRLVDSGLLHRVNNPNDRRSLYLELTPLAHQMMRDVHRDFVALLEAATSDLDRTELDTFSATLQSVARSMVRHSARADTSEPREELRPGSAGSTTHL
ncbi:MarR family transcriptional regulator [Cryobacterium psychrotolerans]|nr:MarR family transcriptional regulator [Cryobacterium psychrotolerans]